MQKIDVYCKHCRKKTGVSHLITGNGDAPALQNVLITCPQKSCKEDIRVLTLKKFTEAQLIKKSIDGKIYL